MCSEHWITDRLQAGPVMVALLLLMAVACAAYAQPARPEMSQAKPLERADNHLDVAYLPQRQVGAWEDRWLRMNVHVPAGGGPFPCIVFVHGGGYGGGDKDGTLYGAGPPPRELLQRAVDEGYVAVNLNYVLGRGTKPQVFWDYKTAIRFLRTSAGRFKLDPGRIAVWGFSAGGWLASTAGFSGPEDSYACPTAARKQSERSVSLAEAWWSKQSCQRNGLCFPSLTSWAEPVDHSNKLHRCRG